MTYIRTSYKRPIYTKLSNALDVFSDVKLAKRIRVSQPTLRQVLRGKHPNPRPIVDEIMKTIAQAYDKLAEA